MTKVFIGGSRHVNRLNSTIRSRLNNIISNGYKVLVGDANGADKAVQKFLSDMHYKEVVVYCSGGVCRNNIGKWEVVNVTVPSNMRGIKFYMVKDAEMADTTDYGLMLWDGKSAGTLNNVLSLLARNKKVLLYYLPEKQFYTMSKLVDLEQVLDKCNSDDLSRIDKKINLSRLKEALTSPEQLSLHL